MRRIEKIIPQKQAKNTGSRWFPGIPGMAGFLG
jgi:hypothetical protein